MCSNYLLTKPIKEIISTLQPVISFHSQHSNLDIFRIFATNKKFCGLRVSRNFLKKKQTNKQTNKFTKDTCKGTFPFETLFRRPQRKHFLPKTLNNTFSRPLFSLLESTRKIRKSADLPHYNPQRNLLVVLGAGYQKQGKLKNEIWTE